MDTAKDLIRSVIIEAYPELPALIADWSKAKSMMEAEKASDKPPAEEDHELA